MPPKPTTIHGIIKAVVHKQADIHEKLGKVLNVATAASDLTVANRTQVSGLMLGIDDIKQVTADVGAIEAECNAIIAALGAVEAEYELCTALQHDKEVKSMELESLQVISQHMQDCAAERAALEQEVAGLGAAVTRQQAKNESFRATVADRKKRDRGAQGKVSMAEKLEIKASKNLGKIVNVGPKKSEAKKKPKPARAPAADLLDDLLNLGPALGEATKAMSPAAATELSALEQLLMDELKGG